MTEMPNAAESVLKVFLFTDLEGSVELKRRMGDPEAARLIAAHDALAARCRADHGCEESYDIGDGFLAVFERPSAALGCALAFQRGLRALGPTVRARVGIHLGESSRVGPPEGPVKYIGLATDAASRVMGLAQGGQILMTREVFDSGRQHLLAAPGGEELLWLAHGPYRFKGGPEEDPPTEIFEVGTPGFAPLAPPPDGEKARRAIRPGDEITLGWRPGPGLPIPGRGGWTLMEKLSEGGFGEVWTASQSATKFLRAFKFCFHPDRLRSLRRELTLFRLLKETLGERPDIARLYDVRLEEAPYFLEMEYSPLGDLRDWAEREAGGIGAVPLEARLELMAQVAEALAAAHSVGVIHKDVKPANVLIERTPDGAPRAKLTDFGIGLLASPEALAAAGITAAGFTEGTASALLTELSSLTGTRLYMAPELLAGKPPTVQSDIYALGVMLYQAVVGDLARPLAHGWERDVEDQLVREDVAACVDGDPARRLPGAQALAERLRSLEARRAEREAERRAEAEAEQLKREAERARRRRRGYAGLAAGLAVLLLAASLVALREGRLRGEAGAERERADERAAAAEAQRERAEFERQRADERAEAVQREQYVSSLRMAQANLAADQYHLVEATLLSTADRFRNWEWGYLVGEAHPELMALRGHEKGVLGAAFSPDGDRLVTASADMTARVWDAATGRELVAFRGHESPVRSPRFSPDGGRVVTASEDKTARVWDAATGQELLALRGHENWVTSAAFSPDGTRVVTASGDMTARVWDAATGQELRALRGHEKVVGPPGFSPDGTRVVTASLDRTARVWDAATGQELLALRGHDDGVWSAAFSPDGTRIVTASWDRTARVWDAATGQELLALRGHDGLVWSAAFSPDGTRIVTASWDRTARVWDSATGQELLALRGHGAVEQAAFGPDGTRIVTASLDRTARVWQAATGDQFLTLRGHEATVNTTAFSPDGTRIVTASRDGTARVWEAATGRELLALRGHDGEVWSAAFSPDGTRIVTASVHGTARLWEAATGQELLALRGHEEWVWSAAFSPDGTRIVTASWDPTARVWDAATGQELLSLRGHDGLVYSAAFSPDGTRIVTASVDGTARVWEAATGRELLALRGHEAQVYRALFSPDGTRIVTASQDQTARVWDAATGQELLALRGHDDEVNSAAFSPDGTRIVTASRDGTARIWETFPWKRDPELPWEERLRRWQVERLTEAAAPGAAP